ncbi:MAG: bifunctional [glutamine synthetase] adenylyltransferase/[glutamine synthetase]-adenylyl-L-tyrosine phosphorylase, partial [Alphaproteobacteria bacterium]|nr:bifunctional [glutamine synthetase] adenylyltransferase/[glutamine synthetase]-adenylyl-L-tyrosine phosphorylase [Alphaproteobacteria bacterium]
SGRLVEQTPTELLDANFERLRGQAAAAADIDILMRCLRQAKERTALLIAVADIGDHWPLTEIVGQLSAFAELSLKLALDHLLRDAAKAGELRLDDLAEPARGSGLSILAMGKLGAKELNYSSDIDLIVLYDQELVDYTGPATPLDCFVRLTRSLVRIMQERTGDGYVFRTDLRLRPDTGSTPPAISMAAAETYYESVGQNWERAALIKARAVAGDIAAGQGFLDRIAPFIWRKHLDFAAIEDIHSIKRQIHSHRGHRRIAVAGHNIKVGRGGIREIEFFAQTQQLIAGGRDRSLRVADTCGALRALTANGSLAAPVTEEMIAAYEFLRRLEHRMQMVADEQTQELPADLAGLDRLATFLGYADGAIFDAELLGHLRRVEGHYAKLFEHSPELGDVGNLVFTGTEDDPDTIATLRELGFREPATVAALVRSWHHGSYRATRSVRARELLTELMPALLKALANTANPDTAMIKFDEFLGRLPTGVQLFSLFYARPGLLDLVAEIMGSAPRLAERLSRNPTLLDGVIDGDPVESWPGRSALAQEMASLLAVARDFEDVLDITRRWGQNRMFQVGVEMLRNSIDASSAGNVLSDLAELLIAALMTRVTEEFETRHGGVPGGGFAVLGLGKLGAREMTPESDLDLMFCYGCPDESTGSDGAKPLSPIEYYSRLSKRLINALTALTGEGRLYEVDMRLRPSGAKGPIAVHIEGFARYQRETAWTWEHMALIRGRVICGPPDIAAAITEIIGDTIRTPRQSATLMAEVVAMRQRIEREHGTDNPWSVKHVRGGIVDLDFICQALILEHAAARPEIVTGNTVSGFRRLANAGCLAHEKADELMAATELLHNVQSFLRLSLRQAASAEELPEGLKAALAVAVGAADFNELSRRLLSVQDDVQRHFESLVASRAAAPPESPPEVRRQA